MENFRGNIAGRWAVTTWTTLVLAIGGAHAGPNAAPDPAVANADTAIAVDEARLFLERGDAAYRADRFDDAAIAYRGAVDALTNARGFESHREAAIERLVQASVQHARKRAQGGDPAAARLALDQAVVLAPDHPSIKRLLEDLDDPIRNNPASSADHARDIDEVRRLLYQADGAHQLGDFDKSDAFFEEVLRIDPTNHAARRGMERNAAARSGHRAAAYDHARAEMLAQVDAAWESQAPPVDDVALPGLDDKSATADESVTLAARLDQLVIPRVALDQANLEEAIDYLRAVTRDLTGGEGVNFNVNLAAGGEEAARRIRDARFDLQLTNVPLRQVLRIIADMTRTDFRSDGFAVIFTAAGSVSDALVTRNYRVPPDFLTSLGATSEAGSGSADPFAGPSAQTGLLAKRLTAREVLEAQGVSFPDGAGASYNPSTNTLRITNTEANQEIIAQMIDTVSQTEPVMVAVRVKLIRTEQQNLEELGFDWLVSPFGLSANHLFASGGTIGNGLARTNADFINPVGSTSIPGIPSDPGQQVSNIVTGGLRSGDGASTGDSIDSLIASQSGRQQSSVAPGVLSLTGLFSDGEAQMILRGLDQKKGIDIMAQPSTVTRNGQASTIEIVREFIYPTEYEPPELPNTVGSTSGAFPVTPATPTAFETKNTGITLEVLPVVDSSKRTIDVTINPSFIEFDGFVNYGSPINTTSTDALGRTISVPITENAILMPVFSSRRANTQVTIADGATIAIGGLMTDSIQNTEDKVPVIGDVPLMGRLFRSKAKNPVTSALVFLVQVELLDPTGRPYRDR